MVSDKLSTILQPMLKVSSFLLNAWPQT